MNSGPDIAAMVRSLNTVQDLAAVSDDLLTDVSRRIEERRPRKRPHHLLRRAWWMVRAPDRRRLGPVVAFAGALALVLVFIGSSGLLRGVSSTPAEEPPIRLSAAAPVPSGPAGTGTIVVAVDEWSGVEGYRLLAVVWADTPQGSELVGGAFWTMIDSDPFSGADVVHPPAIPSRNSDSEAWATYDYRWNETAHLKPGRYRIEFSANPGELTPYGSHIPSSSNERTCWLDADVVAGIATPVVISGIPGDAGICPRSVQAATESIQPVARDTTEPGFLVLEIDGMVGESGNRLSGVLMEGSGVERTGVAGFAVEVDSDPFFERVVFGEVSEPWPEGDSGRPWPWASGEVRLPAGDYELFLWSGEGDYCCYSRWMPVDAPGLHGCSLDVTTSGRDLVVEVSGIPEKQPDWPECVTP